MSGSKQSRAAVPEGYRIPEHDQDLLEECRVTVFRSSGPGGQHKNTSNTAVRLYHRPSAIVVIGKRERSQRRNMETALDRLRTKLEERMRPKKKRRKTKPTLESKRRRLEEKRKRARAKQSRRRVSAED